jgi:hypothetical protein
MRRRVGTTAMLAGLVGAWMLGLGAPAWAQTGPPPGVCIANATQDAGSHAVGSSFVIRLAPPCAFSPGGVVSVSVNDRPVGTKTADAGGGVAVSIVVQSSTQLLINDPVSVPARCGQNTVVGTGFSSLAGTNVTHTAVFAVTCPAVAVPGRLAFTGANFLRWTAIAFLLVVVGGTLLVRRRVGSPS